MASSPVLDTIMDVVLSPSLWLGLALALSYSALFYGWQRGGARQLGRDMLAGCVGFGLGQLAGVLLGMNLLVVGQVQLLAGSLGALVALLVGQRLAWPLATNR
jgi:hypothetical protein